MAKRTLTDTQTKVRLVSKAIAAGTLLVLALPVWRAPAQMQGGSETAPLVSVTDAPPGTAALPVQWVKVEASGLGVMLAAVARPEGSGPFPTVVLLHGSSLMSMYDWLTSWLEAASWPWPRAGFAAVRAPAPIS